MAGRNQSHAEQLRAASRLAIQATTGITSLIEQMHRTIAGGPAVLGSPLRRPANSITGVIYQTIRGVTKLVGSGIDGALLQLGPMLGESVPGPQREFVRAALNGVLGDFLAATKNPLAIQMALRVDGLALPLSRAGLKKRFVEPGRRLIVMVHGSSLSDLQWARKGHDHGAALERDLGGCTAIYVHYNSGLHVSENGAQLSKLLEKLIGAWPVPVRDLTLVGHSMGGLVARSACHAGEAANNRWRVKLKSLVCIGTPHHGAPLERGWPLGRYVDRGQSVQRAAREAGADSKRGGH